MCDANCIIFGVENINSEDVQGKKVLEFGARGYNGGLKSVINKYSPMEYVGADIDDGPGVDVVCDVEKSLEKFGKDSFDMIVTTEMLEHVRDWRMAISNMKNICKSGGTILITTRSIGFIYHAYPHDFWRYEIEDMKNIFADFIVEKVESDTLAPGVFVKVRKPVDFKEIGLSSYELFSVITNSKMVDISDEEVAKFHHKYKLYNSLKNIFNTPKNILANFFRKIIVGK